MSLCNRTYRRCASVALVLVMALIALPIMANAQTAPPPKPAPVSSDDAFPKWDLFVGYQWLNPGGNVPDSSSPPNAVQMPSLSKGFGTSLSYNFTKYFAGEVSYGGNSDSSNYSVNTFTAGPKATYRGEGVDFFVHALIGAERLHAPTASTSTGVAALLGGGMDLKLWRSISIRVFEADFQWSHQNFGNVVPPDNSSLRRPNYDGALLRTGLVFNFGGEPAELPVAASCSVQPTEVMVGEPVHATVTASNFNPKHTLTYSWSSSGGKIEGKDTSASIDTNGVSGGSYTATATVSDPKAKKNNTASCTANFTVKEPPKNPPQLSCSASPSMVQAGQTATITCTCTSPDNVPVTVGGWTATGGSISGNGSSATLGTTGAASGPITISATCTDSRGLTASSSSSVTVENPPPPAPQATKVNECAYPNEKKLWRVDNTCKAELDDVALKLQQDPDAKLVVVGNADPSEMAKSKHKNLAAERALNVKAYISGGEAKQNIDPSRIEARTGNAGTATSEQWIVPSGATFPNADSTTPVDESKVKAIPDHPKPVAKKAKKAE
ncbi:MAG: hypothetical protein ABSG02_06155 [Terriglobales bacterium]|jgi:hypothetical protein